MLSTRRRPSTYASTPSVITHHPSLCPTFLATLSSDSADRVTQGLHRPGTFPVCHRIPGSRQQRSRARDFRDTLSSPGVAEVEAGARAGSPPVPPPLPVPATCNQDGEDPPKKNGRPRPWTRAAAVRSSARASGRSALSSHDKGQLRLLPRRLVGMDEAPRPEPVQKRRRLLERRRGGLAVLRLHHVLDGRLETRPLVTVPLSPAPVLAIPLFRAAAVCQDSDLRIGTFKPRIVDGACRTVKIAERRSTGLKAWPGARHGPRPGARSGARPGAGHGVCHGARPRRCLA
jgi:hypothetical protein